MKEEPELLKLTRVSMAADVNGCSCLNLLFFCYRTFAKKAMLEQMMKIVEHNTKKSPSPISSSATPAFEKNRSLEILAARV